MRSNYVLYKSKFDFYATKRGSRKLDYYKLPHFIDFFETEAAAYREAELRTKNQIKFLEKLASDYAAKSGRKGKK